MRRRKLERAGLAKALGAKLRPMALEEARRAISMGGEGSKAKGFSSEWWKGNSGRAIAAGILLLLPLGIFLLDVDPGALAGCGTYGYGCSYPVCLAVEIDRNCTYNWEKGSAWIYGEPGTEISLYLRVTLTATVSGVEGWSFGVRHSAPTLEAAGGKFEITRAADGPDVQTVKGGAAADFRVTRPWTCGFTQGLVIDYQTRVKLGPRANFFAAHACYRLKFPNDYQVHTVKLEFRDDVGVPAVANVVSRNGQSLTPCKDSLTLYVQCYDISIPSCCRIYGQAPEILPCEYEARGAAALPPGAPGIDFSRGDANADGSYDIADPCYTLGYLFLSGSTPTCKDAADANDDESLDIADAVYSLIHLFLGGSGPPPPFPACGPDLTDETEPVLDCWQYDPCGNPQEDSDGDGLTDAYESQIGTSTALPDTDGDRFSDGQELLPTGVPGCEGKRCSIRVLGADPLKRDLFLELDWMVWPGHHTHLPNEEHLQAIVDAFARPRPYIPGYTPIALHLDTGVGRFNLGNRKNTLPCSPSGMGTVKELRGNPNYFDPARCNVFYYGALLHAHGLYGQADRIPSGYFGVFSAEWSRSHARAGVLMHEFGHCLGLRHGGFEDLYGKPNYRGIMNFTETGMGPTDCSGTPPGGVVFDYSDEELDPINEQCLYEPAGICKVGALPGEDGCYLQGYTCASHGIPQECTWYDFDRDGVRDDERYRCNINYKWEAHYGLPHTDTDVFLGWNDWANLIFFLNGIDLPGGGGGGEPPADPWDPCIFE